MESFEAQLENARKEMLKDIEAVVKAAASDVFLDAQLPLAQGGRMHVDTGFLRNSLSSSVDGSFVAQGAESYILAIGQFSLGEVLFGGWTAEYAGHREYGARGQEPDFYMRGAAMKWQRFVNQRAAEMGL